MNKEIKATITISIDVDEVRALLSPPKKDRHRNADPNAHHNKYKYPDPELLAIKKDILLHDKSLIASMVGCSPDLVRMCLRGKRTNKKITVAAKQVIAERQKLLEKTQHLRIA